MSNDRHRMGRPERFAPRFGDNLFRAGKGRELVVQEPGDFVSHADRDAICPTDREVVSQTVSESVSHTSREVISRRDGERISQTVRESVSRTHREVVSQTNHEEVLHAAVGNVSRAVSNGGVQVNRQSIPHFDAGNAQRSGATRPAREFDARPVSRRAPPPVREVDDQPSNQDTARTGRKKVSRSNVEPLHPRPRFESDVPDRQMPVRRVAEKWAPPEGVQENDMLSEKVRSRRARSMMATPRKALPDLKIPPTASEEQVRVHDLREQIQNNRTRWLDNAKKTPLSQRPQVKLMGGSISGFAVITGLASVITVAAGLLYNESGKATKFVQVPAAPAITITKAKEAPAATKTAEAASPAKAEKAPEIIKAEDSPADASPVGKKTIVSRIAQE